MPTEQNVVFMPALFDHTLQLLMEAHEYFHTHGVEDQARATAWQRSLYSCEMSRITMRLSCVMAWLMVRKAMFAGKISQEDAVAFYRLDSRELCLYRNEHAPKVLPTYVNYLLDESHQLYERVCRLDDQMAS